MIEEQIDEIVSELAGVGVRRGHGDRGFYWVGSTSPNGSTGLNSSISAFHTRA
jgi:hypothetical protein